MFITRKQPMTLDDITTVGIASDLLSIDRLTLHKWIEAGTVPSTKVNSPRRNNTLVVRVRDVVIFAVKNNLPVNKELLSNNVDLSQLNYDVIKHVYYWCEEDSTVELTIPHMITQVTTYELFQFIRTDPFAVFAFRYSTHSNFLIEEVHKTMKPFHPHIWSVGDRISYQTEAHFEIEMEMIEYIIRTNKLDSIKKEKVTQ